MPRLFIADPSLKDIRGHHYMLTNVASQSAQQAGFDVCWLSAKDFSGGLEQNNATVAPTFSASMYANYMGQRENSQNMIARIVRRIFKRNSPPLRKDAVSLSEALFDDLMAAIDLHAIGPQDRILLHTADGASYIAIARLFETRGKDKTPIVHIATPYDPVGVMPNRDSADDVLVAIHKLRNLGALEEKCFLYGENKYLASHLSTLWSVVVRPLDIPAQPPKEDDVAAARAYRRDALGVKDDEIVIATLGSARLEKGFQHFPDIIAQTFARAPDAKIRFALHASPQIIGRHPIIADTINKLNAMNQTSVQLLLEPLSQDDYLRLLHASDIIMLPYGETEYRVRGSGIVAEAVAAGKILIATANSYPGNVALEYGGEVGSAPSEFADAIVKVVAKIDAYKDNAAALSKSYIDLQSVESYWRKCLDAEAQAETA